MRQIKGLDGLLSEIKTLPDVGWLYVDKNFDIDSTTDIINKNYYLAENRDESFEMSDNGEFRTFIEVPIFYEIIDNTLTHHPNATRDTILKAVIYYLKDDNFQFGNY